MNNPQFQAWAKIVRETLWYKIQNYICHTGEYPKAIIAGGEYAYAIMDDREGFYHASNGDRLWRGIPFLRCGAVEKVMIIGQMTDVDLPDVSKGE